MANPPNSSAMIPEKNVLLPVLLFLLMGVVLAYFDQVLLLNTLLLETVHALVTIAIFAACLVYEQKYPHIRQFGWSNIVWGLAFLMIGAIVDILDDPPAFVLGGVLFPFGPSWGAAFIKKTLGYTVGIGLFAYGFFSWIPWMINTRLDIQRLNIKLSNTNRNLNRALMSLDEHVESARITIARELHDDVAQQLTYAKIQLQLCRKALESGEAIHIDHTRQTLDAIGLTVSDALKSVRHISSDLRPEPLFSIGLIPAVEQFLEKLQQQEPNTQLQLSFLPSDPQATHTRMETVMNDQQLLHLFRIIQEGTRNALKHAEAGHIHITLVESAAEAANANEPATQLRICIEDDGKGLPWKDIPTDEALIAQGHLGVVGLKERVKALCGEFSLFHRADGPGTCLDIRIAP